MNIIVDSDIFIAHLRHGDENDFFASLAMRPRWYMSSVVALELRAGCQGAPQIRALKKILDPFERTGRVVFPGHRMWMRAGEIIARLGQVAPDRRQSMIHDTLIALSAVSIGACVVTANRRDFQVLARFLPLTWFGSVEEALRSTRD